MKLLNRYIIESIPRINEVFGGGLSEEAMIHVYGPFQSGKTLLIMQFLYELIGKGFGNGLYLDTEVSVKNNFGNIWWDRFRERFQYEVYIDEVKVDVYYRDRGRKKHIKEVKAVFEDTLNDLNIKVDPLLLENALSILLPGRELIASSSTKNKVLHVFSEVGILELLSLMNMEVEVKGSKEKMDVKIRKYGDAVASPLSTFINKYKVKFIVLDSLGMLIKPLMGGIQDLPARATVINLLLNGLMKIASFYKLIVFVLNHESRSPMNKFYTFYGGSSIGYGFKYNLYLKRIGEDTRELIAYRAPHIPEKGWSIQLRICRSGFYESDKEDCKSSD